MAEVFWILMRIVAIVAAGILSYLIYRFGKAIWQQYMLDGTTPFGRRWQRGRHFEHYYQMLPGDAQDNGAEEPYHDSESPRPELQKPLPERPLPDKPLPPVPGD
jgi:hypothetical protein